MAKTISKKKGAAKAVKGKKASGKDPLPKELVKILACPECKASVKYNAGKTALVCVKCKASYPIKGGIPIMLPSGMR